VGGLYARLININWNEIEIKQNKLRIALHDWN
jgi:hypothetical protein